MTIVSIPVTPQFFCNKAKKGWRLRRNRGWAAGGMVIAPGWTGYSAWRVMMSVLFCPPKPKLLLMHVRTLALRGWLGM